MAFSKFNKLALATRTTPVELLIAKRPPASSVRLNVTVPPWMSVLLASMPTRSLLLAPSETLFAAVSPSLGVEGAALIRLMEMFAVSAAPASSVTVMVSVNDGWDSASKFEASLTVISPVALLIAKTPSELPAEMEYVTDVSASVAATVPTEAPLLLFSLIEND